MIYRVKQFIWAITAKLTQEDKAFVERYLDEEERVLFDKLKVYEQRHSVMVAKELSYEKGATKELVKLGLLHDIGKTVYPIGPIRKSIMVVLDKLTSGKIAKLNVLNMVKCYYWHPELGYQMLKDQEKYNKVFLESVRRHHEEGEEQDRSLLLLKKYDSKH